MTVDHAQADVTEDLREVRALLTCWALREEKKAASKTQAAAQADGMLVPCALVNVGVDDYAVPSW